MNRIMIVILALLCMVCVFAFSFVVFNPNGKLILNEFASIFKPTAYLNYQLNLDDIKEVEVMGAVTLQHTDEKKHIYTNKHKIQKIINYLNGIQFVEAKKDELPNMSPDVTIQFNNVNEKVIGSIWIYGQVFVEDKLDGKLYRSKKDWIIDGIEKIEFD